MVICVLFTLLISEAKANVKYIINSSDESLRSEVKNNLQLYLEDFEPPALDNIGYWKKQLVKQAESSLQALGYYNSNITVTVDRQDNESKVYLDVLMGYPVVIKTSNFEVVGQGASNKLFIAQRNNYSLVVGSKFDHGSYQRTKSAMTDIALTYGFFDAHWQTHKVVIDALTQTAQIALVFDTGLRYKFGKINIKGEHASNNIVRTMAPFDHGDFFDNDQISHYNIALNKSRYFTNVQAIPAKANKQSRQVDINVSVIQRPKNIVEVSAGITSDLGERGRLKWVKPWLNRHGHSLTSEIRLNRQEQEITNNYKVPHGDPNDDYTNYVLGWNHTNNNANTNRQFKKYTLQWQRHQVINEYWKRILLLKYDREDDANETNIRNLIIPGVSYTRSRRHGGITPYWGDRQFVSFEASNKIWGSTSEFYKLTMRSNWLRQINETHQVLLKFEVGYLSASSINDVPTSMRYFGGGDNNLRAYEFKTVSPLDEDNQARGALTQLLGTVEYSYPVVDKWRLAVFYDVGYLGDTFFEKKYVDAGLGVRWETPVGLIRLDFAKGLIGSKTQDFNRPFNISLAIGLDL
jgi:translocation and assembly module TamA